MSEKSKFQWRKLGIADYLQYALNTALVLLAVALCFLLGKEIIYIVRIAFFTKGPDNHYSLIEPITVFFLYFEFIAMIVKYFNEDHHFPIRYFLYIGITAMIRLIIVSHENPVNTLLYTFSILVLIIGYFIMSSATARRGKL